jgi:hypothetical protein
VNGGERRFNCKWLQQEDKKRSGDPKVIFEGPTETLRFYRKRIRGGV